MSPTTAPTGGAPVEFEFVCPDGTDLLAFHFIPDVRPSDMGIRLWETETGATHWNFQPRSLGSMALVLRSHVFVECVDQGVSYGLEVTDTSNNGLVSFFGTSIYGSFSLARRGQTIFDYQGNCDNNETVSTECGAYCECNVDLTNEYWRGGCSPECESNSIPFWQTNGTFEVETTNAMAFACPPRHDTSLFSFEPK